MPTVIIGGKEVAVRRAGSEIISISPLGVITRGTFTKTEREQLAKQFGLGGARASFGGGVSISAQPTPSVVKEPIIGTGITETIAEIPLEEIREVPIAPTQKTFPIGTRVGTRISGGVTFAVVAQGGGRPAKLVEETAFLQQRETQTARELTTREAALGQQAIEQASLRKQLKVRRAELERLSRSQVVPAAFFTKKLREFEALGGKFEVSQKLRKTLVSGFRAGEQKFEKTQEQLAGIAEAKRITGIIAERKKGVPIGEMFGLETAEATKLIARLEAEQKARVLSAGLVGTAQQVALEKQKLREIQAKAGFATEGPAGFLGLTKEDIASIPIIAESLARKQRVGRARVKFLAEAGDIPGAFLTTAELIGRKGVETLVPPTTKEAPGLFLIPKEATPTISAIRGVLGLKTLAAGQQFTFLGGTREELIAKGGLAGTTLAEFAALQIAFGAITGKIKPPKDAFKGLDLGEAAIIGKVRKKLPITRITKAEATRLRKLGVIVKPTVTELKVPKITKEAARQLKDLSKDFVPTGAAPPSGTIGITIPKGILRKPIEIKVPVSIVAREAKAIQALKTQELIRSFARGETLKGLTKPKFIVKTKVPTKAKFLPGSLAALSEGLAKPQIEVTKTKFLTPEATFTELKRQAVDVLPQFKVSQKIAPAQRALLAGVVLTSQQEKQLQKEAEKQAKISVVAITQPQAIVQAEKLTQSEKQRQRELSVLGFAQPQAFAQAEKRLQKERERTAVATIFDFPGITKQRITQRQRAVRVTIKERVFEDITKPKAPRLKIPKLKLEKGVSPKQIKKLVQAFAIVERRRGKFRRVGTGVFPKIAALSKALKRAEETAAVTVKIVPVAKAVKPSKGADLRQFLKLRGRFRKGRAGTFIEKRRFRISTPGELEEITFAPRRKKRVASILPTFKKSKGGLSIL